MSIRAFLTTLLVLGAPGVCAAQPETIATVGDAYVSHDAAAERWRIGNTLITFTLGIEAGSFRALEVDTPRIEPIALPGFDTFIASAGRQLPVGAASSGFTLERVQAAEIVNGVRLDAVFLLRDPRLRVTRSYACYRRSPVIETWTRLETLGTAVTVDGLNTWQLTVPNGTLHTITGLLNDSADNPDPRMLRQFTSERRELASGRLSIGADGRSTERWIPWISVEASSATVFGGLMWSGSWNLTVDRTGGSLRMTLGLTDFATTIPAVDSLEAPHGFFGVTLRARSELSLGMKGFITRGIRADRPFDAPLLYNTWFAYATDVDQETMRTAIDAAARLQLDVFMLDAGWWRGSGRDGAGDFTSGLGDWQVDAAKFPEGLRPLAEYAEAAGLRFGIWVEPERVDRDNTGRNGFADERWLAQRNGDYGSTEAGQLCLSDARARQWILDRLIRLIEEVRPAYLKWDNNFWINCNRAGHGHGPRDGNFAHVVGLYRILGELRARYPDLLIENVAGGGNRLDFGMLRYTDTAWMDDRSAPSAVVRHNLEGLGTVFPPAYLLSFALDGPGEPIQASAPDLQRYLRSRMMGALGLTFRPEDIGEEEEALVRAEIATYRGMLATLQHGAGVLLTDQIGAEGPAWDAFELVTAAGDAVVFAFQNDEGVDRVTIQLRGLRPQTVYDVISLDTGLPVRTATGRTLMNEGVEIVRTPASASHVLVIRPSERRPEGP